MLALLLPLLLVAPLAALACLALKGERAAGRVAIAGAAAPFALALVVAGRVLERGEAVAANGWLHADAFAALLAVTVGAVGFAAAWYGRYYMPFVERREKKLESWHAGRYHALYLALLGSLFVAAFANNLGLMWIAIEASTLASALLVGYYRRPGAVEAGWKFLILCSVGITLALFATVLVYASAIPLFGEGSAGLQWTALRAEAARLDPKFVRLAFLFALVGYGTKAGLVPMHTWLPDAHSQAPTPVSALLSGGVLITALGALLRFHVLAAGCTGPAYSDGLLVLFGLLSLAVSVPFLLLQGDYKRLLAYSSVEQIGLTTLAIGFGTPLALFGAMFHLVVQSLAKTLAFLAGGTLSGAFDSRRHDHWSGALECSRETGALFVVGGVALAGLPPAALFLSEWLVLIGGLKAGRPWVVGGAIALLAVAFAGLAFHWTRAALGRPRPGYDDQLDRASRAPMWALAAALVVLGVWIPSPFRRLLEQAAAVIRP